MVSVGFAIAAPFLYAGIGRNVAACNVYAVVGVIGAAIYNPLPKWIGGIEVEVKQSTFKAQPLQGLPTPTTHPLYQYGNLIKYPQLD